MINGVEGRSESNTRVEDTKTGINPKRHSGFTVVLVQLVNYSDAVSKKFNIRERILSLKGSFDRGKSNMVELLREGFGGYHQDF